MNKELAELFRTKIFQCTRCGQRLMNPYLHCNGKHDPLGRPEFPENRRKFQLEYIASKDDIRVVIVGEAPGLDGCGYGGIAFTGEYNAVCQLGLANYHGTKTAWQKEQSANLLYGALENYCQNQGCAIPEAARNIYLTNAIMCVPLGENGRSITAPAAATKQMCQDNLIRQIQILQPRLVITLGANALNAVGKAFALKLEGKLTDLVREQRTTGKGISAPDFELIAEIHPSPRNRVLGELYTALPDRLKSIFTDYLG